MIPTTPPAVIVAITYVGGFLAATFLLRAILRYVDPSLRDTVKRGLDTRDVGFWIGLCEYFLTVSFVIADEYTAVALIFAAKEIVRSDKVRERPSYYLLGTLLNISMAIGFALLARLAMSL